MKTPFSFSSFAAEAQRVLRRFPVCMAALASLTLALIVFIFREEFNASLIFYLSTAFLLNLLGHLALEEARGGRERLRLVAVQVVLNLLLMVDAAMLYQTEKPGLALFLGNAAAVAALLLALVPLPFWRDGDDRRSWRFGLQLVQSVAFSYLVGSLMCGGLAALYGGITILFGLHAEFHVFSLICTLTLVTLPLLLTLIRLPGGAAKQQWEAPGSRFMLGAVRYLFLPLVGLYMAVLYVYLLRILVQMTLPKGMVTILVSTMMGGLVVLRIVLYPYLERPERSLERKALRLLPLLALPLVGLMSVGVAHRVGQYGITFPRLYAILLNLWFYAVCLGLGLRRTGRVRWLPLSVAALLLLSSAHPFNFVEVARRVRSSSAERLLRQFHTDGKPMDRDAFRTLLQSMPETDSRRLFADVAYLCDKHYDTDSLLLQAHFRKERLYLSDYDWFMDGIGGGRHDISLGEYRDHNPRTIPQGCRQMAVIADRNAKFHPLGSGTFEVRMEGHSPLHIRPEAINFQVPAAYTLRIGESDTLLVVQRIYIPDSTKACTGTITGWIFYP